MAGSSDGDAELYWSLVLCRYGIEYVDDPLTKKKIATCHRTQFKSILDDPDYQTALAHADMSQRSVYEREAAYIDKMPYTDHLTASQIVCRILQIVLG